MKFSIDFFELAFLAEACIPPVPIARHSFWQRLTTDYYHQMTPEERNRLWDWMNKLPQYQDALKENKDVQIFEARFNPNNKYLVITTNGEKYDTFLFKGRHYTEPNRSIIDDYIQQIKPI